MNALVHVLLFGSLGISALLVQWPVSYPTKLWLQLFPLAFATLLLGSPSLRPRFGGWGVAILVLFVLSTAEPRVESLAWQALVFALALLLLLLTPSEAQLSWRPSTAMVSASAATFLTPPSDVFVLPSGTEFVAAVPLLCCSAALSAYLPLSRFSRVIQIVWCCAEPLLPLALVWAIWARDLQHGYEAIPWWTEHLWGMHAVPAVAATLVYWVIRLRAPALRAEQV